MRVSLLSGIERGHELPDEATLIALEGVYGPAVRTAVLSALPEGLAQLHAAAPLSFPWLRTLCRLEFRVTRPGVQEWAELYEQLRKLQAYRDL